MARTTTPEGVGPSVHTEDQPTLKIHREPLHRPGESPVNVGPLEATAFAFQSLRHHQPEELHTVDLWCQAYPWQEHAQMFRDLHQYDPRAADRLAQALTSMPMVGSEFLGFHLLAHLGHGGFARVYLAQQGDLANRYVVLKVAADLWGEAHTLAQLQHPHIVPVYSVHQSEPFQAVCMPYLGWTTFQDILNDVQEKSGLPAAGTALLGMIKKAPAICEPVAAPPAVATAQASFAEKLAGLTYVEAVVWLCAQLADGLAHAHEHGIVHHDLKPANILLTDDGQPMLLDFNAAEDTKRQTRAVAAWVAGTLPYVAPEQLAVLQGLSAHVDARSDLYAFGVILFELLTGRYPFPYRHTSIGLMGERILAERRGTPPPLRPWNPAVSPALEAIVRRCLEPDPARRYQTARALQEDLQCQHEHRPLVHTAEPSLQERLHKWARRHPQRLSLAMLAAFFACLLGVVTVLSIMRSQQFEQWRQQDQQRIQEQQEREAALAAWQNFQDELKTAQFLLYTRTNEPEQRAEGVSAGKRLVERYHVAANPSWQETPLVKALPAGEQHQLGEAMGELLLLLARALFLQNGENLKGAKDSALLETALLLNERAAACSAPAAASPALWRQRAALSTALGRNASGLDYQAKADAMPLRTAADYYWLASDHIASGRLREALPLLRKATQQEPQNFWAWFVLANCYDRLSNDARAEACYGACVALRPASHWAYFNRGLALLRQLEYRAACDDFDTVIALRPALTDAYLNRALAYQGLQQYPRAEQDLSEALKRGGPTRLYFLRARIREKRGDKEGAQRDLDEGLRLPPADEKSLLARGFYLLNRDPKAALADFDAALRRNPRSADALQNKAHVLAEKLGRDQEALEALNQLLTFYPDSVKARGGRGVLLARLGQREQALRDAEESLLRDASPLRLYQVACIYALTSKQEPEDRLQAFHLLSSALRKGYGFNLLETDTDLNPIRPFAEFRRLVDAARALRPMPPKAKKT